MDNLPEAIARVEGLLEKVMPAPWELVRDTDGAGVPTWEITFVDPDGGVDHTFYGVGNALIEEAELFVALRNHAPALLAAAKDAESLRALLGEVMDCLKGHMIGINCHGPVLTEEQIARIAAATGGES